VNPEGLLGREEKVALVTGLPLLGDFLLKIKINKIKINKDVKK
jgi:hypothetical protein